jgi:hypothetical protein
VRHVSAAARTRRPETVLTKALEKDAALRYQSAADLRADLARVSRDIGKPAGTPRRAPGVLAGARMLAPAIDRAVRVSGSPNAIVRDDRTLGALE